MRHSIIKEKLKNGKPTLLTQLHLTDPSIFEMVSVMGFDGIWMDLEHHGYSLETAGNLIRAARVGSADILARAAKGEFMRMGRLLEMGAQGIMYPRCSDASEAKEVVRWTKFAPLGERGFDGAGADAFYTGIRMNEYIRKANDETFVVIQLEDPKAVESAEAIAAVEGVDVIMLGPADFSVLSGIPGQFDHPTIESSLNKIAEAAANTGKHWASTVADGNSAERLLKLGAGMVLHNADICIIKKGLEAMRDDFSKLGFKFRDNPI
ncbi:MAG: aldolase/citrate lyase family protein [Verrucomicrobiota bacterium]|jgi:4-hydroxy-2-oxoheptanedioate aldolase|nr:aldolase/citrate lyase family protein [Verrucomicrobiota bacterium]|tara:strand:+ start:412 stop:1206 length:795 start_codon:yes stop_codon:yes gene_type:complete